MVILTPHREWGFFLPFLYVHPRINMGAHPRPRITFRVATCYYGHPQIGVVSHVPDWASTCVQVAWPRATMGVHLSGWASNLRQLRASTHKNWASNFGGILVAHLQGLGLQLGRIWTSIVDRSGHPVWTNMEAQYGQRWASILGGFGYPLWIGVDTQYGQTWTSNVDENGRPRWAEVDAQCGQDLDAQFCPLQDAHNYASIMGAHCWTAILWGCVVAHYWVSIRAQLLDAHTSPLWVGFLGVPFGRMWAHPNGAPTSLVHAASTWPGSSLLFK